MKELEYDIATLYLILEQGSPSQHDTKEGTIKEKTDLTTLIKY